MGLYEWQKEAIQKIRDGLLSGTNHLVVAPTGAGKTRVLFAAAGSALMLGYSRIFYCAPTKAITYEKYAQLRDLFGKENVGVATGDIKVGLRQKVIVVVQEVYRNMFAHVPIKALVIADEAHSVFSYGDVPNERSRALIDSLRLSRRSHAFILATATPGDSKVLIEYLRSVTGRKWELFETDFRPSSLEFVEKVGTRSDLSDIDLSNTLVFSLKISSIPTIMGILAENLPYLPVSAMKTIKLVLGGHGIMSFSERYPQILKGVAPYHSKMTYTERRVVSRLVDQGFIKVVVATSALGSGVNMPFRQVIFTRITIPHRSPTGDIMERLLTKMELLQMGGRAGRPGFFDSGVVRYIPLFTDPFTFDIGKAQKEWTSLIEKEIEQPRIILTPDYRMILYGHDPEEEIEYCSRYSLPQVSGKVIKNSPEYYFATQTKLAIDRIRSEHGDEAVEAFRELFSPEITAFTNKRMFDTIVQRREITVQDALEYARYNREIINLKNMSPADEVKMMYTAVRILHRARNLKKYFPDLRVDDPSPIIERIKKVDPLSLMI